MMIRFCITLLILGLSYNLTNSAAVLGKNYEEISNLLQISGNNSCNSSNSYIYRKIPEISSLCNISVIPNPIHANILLMYNEFTPVLCMGVIDLVSQICKIGINSSVIDSFPTFLNQSNLTNKINNSDYNSLKNFCSGTVSNFTTNKKEDNSVLTILKNELKIEEKCNLMCRHINESGRVNPLCSFIVWSESVLVDQSILPKTEKATNEEIMDNGEDKHSSTAALALGTDNIILASAPAAHTADKANEDSTNLGEDSGSKKKQVAPTKDSGSKNTQMEPSNDISNLDKAVSVNNEALSKDSPQANDVIADNKVKSEADSKTNGDLKPSAIPKIDADSTVNDTSSASKLTEGEPTTNKTKADNVVPEIPESNGQKPSNYEEQPPSQDTDVYLNENTDQNNKNEDYEGVTDMKQETSDVNGIDKPPLGVDMDGEKNQKTVEEPKNKNEPKPKEYADNDYKNNEFAEQNPLIFKDPFIDTEDTPFFSYFLFMSVLTIVVYLVFHNKNKLVALAVEGRRKKGSRRRPNSSQYSKLHCSLEEAMASKTSSATVTQVLY